MKRSHGRPHRQHRTARAGIPRYACTAIIAALYALAPAPVSLYAQAEQQQDGIVVIPLDPPASRDTAVTRGSGDTAGDATANDTTANDTTANDTTANDTTASDTTASDAPLATPDDSAHAPHVERADALGASGKVGQSAPPPSLVLEIASVPSGATLYIDGEYRGETPFLDSHMTAGVHEITLELDAYKPFSRKMSFPAHTHKRLNIRMFSLVGTVSVFSDPSDVAVSIDDSVYGVTPLHALRLEKGTYALDLTREDYVPHTDSITVQRNAHDTLAFVLRSIRYADSVAHARRTRRQWVRRISFAAIAAAFGAAGYSANQDVRESIDNEEELYKRYRQENLTASEYEHRWSAYESARATTDTYLRRRTFFYIIGGVFAAAFSVSIPF